MGRLDRLIMTYDELEAAHYPIHPAIDPYDSDDDYDDDWLDTQQKQLFNRNRSYFAIDCEMLITTHGKELGRVSMVDPRGNVVLDEYVRPYGQVIDYKTPWSGLTPYNIQSAKCDLYDIQRALLNFLCTDDVLIGHAFYHDLRVLKLRHPRIIDTIDIYGNVALKTLARNYLGINIQNGPHDSVEDARATMDLVRARVFN